MMTNPYSSLETESLAGLWGMRAAELMPRETEVDALASASRDTAFMLLAGAMRIALAEIQRSEQFSDAARDGREQERQVRLEVLRRAASLAVPESPEAWLREARATDLVDVDRALESDEGMCDVLRYLQQIAWIGGRWHTSTATPEEVQ